MQSSLLKAAACVGALIGAASIPGQAQAAAVICSPEQLANAIGATACTYVVGNANSNDSAKRALQASAIALLGASDYEYEIGTQADNSYKDGSDALSLGSTIDFGKLLYGETLIAMHIGNGAGTPWRPTAKSKGNAGGVTAFYLYDFTTPTSSITLNNAQSLSNAHLYTTTSAVPEPSTWLMLLLGFFGVGANLRRSEKRRQVPALA